MRPLPSIRRQSRHRAGAPVTRVARAAPASGLGIVLGAAMLVAGCGGTDAGGSGAAPAYVVRDEDSRIVWDQRTLRRPFDGPASYPRMIRLRDGDLLLSLESRGASLAIRSADGGATWSAPVTVASAHDGIIAAVPSLLQLRDGTVLLAYNTRPPHDNRDPAKRFGIRLAASDDAGRTWRERAIVYTAGVESGRGVWEPSMLELPTGEVLLFVADEQPYDRDDDQEVAVLRSADAGVTWSAPRQVSWRAGHRDGMPVPLLLRDGSGIAIAIEDDGLSGDAFKPAIVWMPVDGAPVGTVGGDSALRWSALTAAQQLPAAAYGGAPFLAQFPDGETVLSFQSDAGRSGGWSRSTMMVALGDARARSFAGVSRPFAVPDGRHALWGSLFVHDADTITALTTTDAYSGSVQELYLIDGRRIAQPAAVAASEDGSRTPSGRL
ncbi:MAG TPA: sialidase family protein [Planctomycetota bacterium]|nr:sialidase family protein [Planctomycetota bacterium]